MCRGSWRARSGGVLVQSRRGICLPVRLKANTGLRVTFPIPLLWKPNKENFTRQISLEKMASIQLYSDSRLPCPQRVLVTAAEKGIDLEIIHTDVFAGENKVNNIIHTL